MKPIAVLERELEDVKVIAMQIANNPTAPETIKKSAISNYNNIKFAVNTVKNQFPKQLENAEKNKVIKSINIKNQIGKLKGKTCVAIAFGASVEKDIEKIRYISRNKKIICADIAVSWLMDNGIKPDYIVSLDANINPIYLGNKDLSGIHLFASAASNHDYIARAQNAGATVSMFCTECRLNSHVDISKASGINECLKIAGNVSFGMAYIPLSVMGCRKLILFGYDYCWKSNYYPGIEYHGDIEKGIKENTIFEVQTTDKEKAYTNMQLLNYRNFLKDYLFTNKLNGKVVNAGSNGITSFVGYYNEKEIDYEICN
jgi:hypothetical protein